MDSRLVSVVIPTFNRLNDLRELIDSLLVVSEVSNIEIIIIDNDSSDINFDALMDKISLAGIKACLLVNKVAGSLSRSRNMGIRAAGGEFIFFIDDDNIVEKYTIMKLLDVFENDKGIGIVSPVAFYYNERNRVLDAGAKRNYWNSFTINLFLNEDRRFLPSGIIEVSEVSNAFMVRKAVFEKIGVFDEINFPIDLDEADLCLRVKKTGLKIFAACQANIYHKVDKINSLSITSLRFRREKNAYYMGRNRIIFQKKHLPVFAYLIFLIFFSPVFCFLYLFSQLLPQPGSNLLTRFKYMIIFLQGIGDGLFYGREKLRMNYA